MRASTDSSSACALVQTRSAVWTRGVVSTFFLDEAAAPISGGLF